MKVIDKIKAVEAENKTLYSFEFYVPKTENGVGTLSKCMEKLVSHAPSFCDITWRSTGELTLEIANIMQNFVGVETMMHLTCLNMSVDKIDHALDKVKSYGVRNVLALRGDPPRGQDKFVTVDGGFSSALDLVNHMRSKYGDYFGITVAGYPEAHPDVIGANGLVSPEAYASDLAYLKRKVDAGADLIITQLFYDTDVFLKFVNDCRQIGIDCPIVPGIMPIDSYKRFLGSTRLCKTKVPQEIIDALEPIKDNDEAVRAYGIHLGTEMCKKILASGIKQLHLYTMNLDKPALAILQNLGLIEESKIQKSLPWKRPKDVNRTEEDGQHINCHSKSHITLTTVWDQNQHEQGGDNRIASNGATLCDHQLTTTFTCDEKLQAKSAVSLQNFEDIHEIFKNACLGKLRKQF